MPVKLLTATQRKKLSRFPSEVPRKDLICYFSLCKKDVDLIRTLKGDANKMGFALQLSALR